MFKIKNVSKNTSVVCTLKDGSSLRLLPKNEVTINNNQVTDYLEELSKAENPLILMREVKDSVKDKKVEKPEKDNKEVK